MPESIEIASGVSVPGSAITVRAVRSSGPGGQNVNKVSSCIEMRVEIAAILGLDELGRRRLAALAGRKVAQGTLHITAQRSRDQWRNLEDARGRVRSLVERALVAPRPRRPTTPSRSAEDRRIRKKKLTGVKKRFRTERDDE